MTYEDKHCFCVVSNQLSRPLTGNRFCFLSLVFCLCGQVTAEVGRRSLSLAVDESAPVATAALRGNQLDVDKRLYLGGLPANHSTRRLNVMTSQPPPPITARRLLLFLTASSAPLFSPRRSAAASPAAFARSVLMAPPWTCKAPPPAMMSLPASPVTRQGVTSTAADSPSSVSSNLCQLSIFY